jgi:hypothetical protein
MRGKSDLSTQDFNYSLLHRPWSLLKAIAPPANVARRPTAVPGESLHNPPSKSVDTLKYSPQSVRIDAISEANVAAKIKANLVMTRELNGDTGEAMRSKVIYDGPIWSS